jgi:type IV/VI secretion system ImpK/VasF family protein
MKLLETYEEFFQYICRLNRVAKTQAQPEYVRIRSEIKDQLEQLIRIASSEVRLLNQVKQLQLPTVFFIDYIIRTSRFKFATQWAENSLAAERNELAGDERFFDLLEEDLKDTSDEAAERLAIYYHFLGFGFLGMYQTQPEQVRRYLEQGFPRVRQWMDNDPRTKISEEAYQHTDTRVLTEPPSKKIVLVAVAFAFLCLSVMLVYYAFYANAVKDLSVSVQVIKREAQKNGQ